MIRNIVKVFLIFSIFSTNSQYFQSTLSFVIVCLLCIKWVEFEKLRQTFALNKFLNIGSIGRRLGAGQGLKKIEKFRDLRNDLLQSFSENNVLNMKETKNVN